ncbi:hypothetical protein MAM1_0014d01390 [Mucor ambiguus]|uniref:F-box domain-containing protein n=1 Tax=Mucor ambiguus TaxID=91626 RepID=A0A0C9MJ76_9FUNG|nr:hypothetical protein MAM1_0014d01390 [Mucor ambiguus]
MTTIKSNKVVTFENNESYPQWVSMRHATHINIHMNIADMQFGQILSNPSPTSLMAHITALPAELLSAIFDNIDSNHQLAQCRLVCQHWNDPAARSMFGNTITITSDKAASRLFRHLFLHSPKIPLIRHLNFELEDDELPMNTYRLLLLAIHPNIVNMTGSVKSEAFFKVLFDIIDSSPQEFAKLETVPSYTGPNVDFNITVALKFKKSLVFPTVALDGKTTSVVKDFLRNLDQFPKLDTIIFRGHLDGLEWMEDLLRSNSNLDGFGIGNFVIKNFLADRRGMHGIIPWFHSGVQQEEALEYILINSPMFRPEAIMYFCYKYPNLKYIELKGRIWVPEGRNATDDDIFITLALILDAVKKVEIRVIHLVLPKNISMLAAMKFLPKREEDIDFSIEEIGGQNEVVFSLIDEMVD